MNLLEADRPLSETDASKQETYDPEKEKLRARLEKSEAESNYFRKILNSRDSMLESLIGVCRANGVSLYKSDTIRLEFFPPTPLAAGGAAPGPIGNLDLEPGVLKELEDDSEPEEASVVSEEMREELRINDLMVNDPGAWEQDMIDSFKLGDE